MFEEFIKNKDSWLNGRGPASEVVFSSRIRLARNFSDKKFPTRASAATKEQILKKVKDLYPRLEKLKNVRFLRMEDVSELDRQFLLERHLISQDHITSPAGKGLIVSNDERISIMINEEDHIRMQVITSGFDLANCWQTLNAIDDELDKFVSFSFSNSLGYLTACPTNVGTGLRASCMLHLPALIVTKKINKILELLAKISFTTRGLFGEGTQALGDFFQISNQISLGPSEKELIDNLWGVVNQLKQQEMEARNALIKKYKIRLEDSIWRALGTLRNSRLITSKEALSNLSMLSLGLNLGIIKGEDLFVQSGNRASSSKAREVINNLIIIIQPAHLQKIEDKQLGGHERDYIRAEILRKKLGG